MNTPSFRSHNQTTVPVAEHGTDEIPSRKESELFPTTSQIPVTSTSPRHSRNTRNCDTGNKELEEITKASESVFPDCSPKLTKILQDIRADDVWEKLPLIINHQIGWIEDLMGLYRQILNNGPCGISYYPNGKLSIYTKSLGNFSGLSPISLLGKSQQEVMDLHYPDHRERSRVELALSILKKENDSYIGLFQMTPENQDDGARLSSLKKELGDAAYEQFLTHGKTISNGVERKVRRTVLKWITQNFGEGRLSFAIEPSPQDLKEHKLWEVSPWEIGKEVTHPFSPKDALTGFWRKCHQTLNALDTFSSTATENSAHKIHQIVGLREDLENSAALLDAYLSNDLHHPVAIFEPRLIDEQEAEEIARHCQVLATESEYERLARNLTQSAAARLFKEENQNKSPQEHIQEIFDSEKSRKGSLLFHLIEKKISEEDLQLIKENAVTLLNQVQRRTLSPDALLSQARNYQSEIETLLAIEEKIKKTRTIQVPIFANDAYLKIAHLSLKELQRMALYFGDISVGMYHGKHLEYAYRSARSLSEIQSSVWECVQKILAHPQSTVLSLKEVVGRINHLVEKISDAHHHDRFGHLALPLSALCTEIEYASEADIPFSEAKRLAHELEILGNTGIGYRGTQFHTKRGDSWEFQTHGWQGGSVRLGIVHSDPEEYIRQCFGDDRDAFYNNHQANRDPEKYGGKFFDEEKDSKFEPNTAVVTPETSGHKAPESSGLTRNVKSGNVIRTNDDTEWHIES